MQIIILEVKKALYNLLFAPTLDSLPCFLDKELAPIVYHSLSKEGQTICECDVSYGVIPQRLFPMCRVRSSFILDRKRFWKSRHKGIFKG